MPYPRPILKRIGTSPDDSDSPYSSSRPIKISSTNKVHFPNHPDALTRTHLAHSPDQYDRSPIFVQPNSCALPERGCPGRTYSDARTQEDMDVNSNSPNCGRPWKKGDHLHPRARITGFNTSHNSVDSPCLPSLIQDLSDTSEDSDNTYTSPSLNITLASTSVSSASSACSSSVISSSASPRLSPKGDPAQLSFLPHPHSFPYTPERPATPYPYPSGSCTRNSRPTRRSQPSPTQQRFRSRSRVRGSPIRDRYGDGVNKVTRGRKEDEGCLGGF